MVKKYVIAVIATFMMATSSYAMAKDGCGGTCAGCHSLDNKEATELIKKTGASVISIKQSPARGLFEMQVEKDGQKGLLLMDYGKKHLIQGMAVDLGTLEPVSAHELNLVEPAAQTKVDVSTIPAAYAINMGNPNGARKLYVFTDPDCPYCKNGHAELKKLAKIAPDVAIYILPYPLPMHPGAYDKCRSILETMNLDVLDKAFEVTGDVPKAIKESSKKSVDTIITFANANGISGTPTMVMPDGKIEVGIPDAETLKKMLTGS